MRYTTLIDITEQPEVYRNVNARLLYLHMCLKAGWHDNDKDRLTASIRQLACDVGITVSACRHALGVLEGAKLIARRDNVWYVRKWFMDNPPTPRPRAKDKARDGKVGSFMDSYEAEVKEYQRQLLEAIRQCDRAELEEWRAELEAGKRYYHHGSVINPNQANIAWLTDVINKTSV